MRTMARVGFPRGGAVALVALVAGCSSTASSGQQSEPDEAAAASTEGGGGDADQNVCGGVDAGTPESAPCTILTSATGSIIDASGNSWTLALVNGSFAVYENGAAAGFSTDVTELAYVGHVVSQENVAGDWWSWAAGNWASETDPTAACSASGGPDGGVFTSGSGEQARMADSFVDSIGANTHFGFGDTNWGSDRDTLIVPGLAKLGIRHLRDALDLSDTSIYPIFADVYDAVMKSTGTTIGFDLVMPYPSQYGSCNAASVNVSNVIGNMPVANIDSFEGINEWNLFNSSSGLSCGHVWQTDLQQSQPALYTNTKGNAQLASIKVLGPPLGFLSFSQLASDAHAVGDLSASMDYGADHSYPSGEMPSTNISGYRQSVAAMDGTKPFTVTESGYYTMPDGNQGISETAHGKYMSRFFLEYFNAGSLRTYVYDLIDDSDGAGTSEGNFGLMRGDGSFKPGATATQNEIALLADPGTLFTPGQLAYSLNGAPAQVHHTLLQKRNGRMYLVLWQEVESYDDANQADLAVTPVAVNVSFGQAFSAVNQYDVVTSATPFATAANAQNVAVQVADQAIVVEIVP
jgi:hypothetical protein